MVDKLKCLQCNGELVKGYIFNSHRVYWSESEWPAFMDERSAEVLIKMATFRMRKTPAYRCEICQLVTFSYGSENK